MNATRSLTRRSFVAAAAAAGLAAGTRILGGPARAADASKRRNILFILTDQERHFRSGELPSDYRLPGHERLMRAGVAFAGGYT